MSLKKLAPFLLFIVCPSFGSLLAAEEINIYFKISPPVEHLRSFSDPATLSLLVTTADGRPAAQGWVEIRLEAPPPGRFFSTDFPLVEGSRLAEMRLPLSRGKTEWKYLFPIRGAYRLTVDFVNTEGKQATKTFPLQIRENESKWYVLALFVLVLFAAGVVAGRIFTQPPAVGKATLGLLVFFGAAGFLAAVPLAAQEAGEEQYFGWLEIDTASVGKPTRVVWRLQGQESTDAPVALLTLAITHLEKMKTVFAVERLPVRGEFTMNFQFTDGADYRVTARADLPGRRSVRTERHVSVTGVEPPITAVIPALSFFIAVIAVGVGVGRWSKTAASRS